MCPLNCSACIHITWEQMSGLSQSWYWAIIQKITRSFSLHCDQTILTITSNEYYMCSCMPPCVHVPALYMCIRTQTMYRTFLQHLIITLLLGHPILSWWLEKSQVLLTASGQSFFQQPFTHGLQLFYETVSKFSPLLYP